MYYKDIKTKEQGTILSNLKQWIKSWFNVVENKAQYDHSYNEFMKYYNSNRNIVGEHYSKHIDDILSNITAKIDSVVYYQFMYRSTFKSKSSSIAESNNAPMKKGSNPVRSGMSIERSALVQTQQVKSKEQKNNMRIAQRLQKYSLFSNTSTKDIVTDYMDLRLCKLFDNKEKVATAYVGNGLWLSVSRKVLDDYVNKKMSFCVKEGDCPSYVNIRRVTYRNGVMNCTCGEVQQMLGPCIHIVSVLDLHTYISPEIIPIRWYQSFLYFHDSEAGTFAPTTKKHCSLLLNKFREDFFDSKGTYVGVDTTKIGFDVSTLDIKDSNNDIVKLCQIISGHVAKEGFLMKGSNAYQNIVTGEIAELDVTENATSTDLRFGSSTQTSLGLSQDSISMLDEEAKSNNICNNGTTTCSNLNITAQDVIALATEVSYECSPTQLENLYKMISDYRNNNLATASTTQTFSENVSFLGQQHHFVRGKNGRKRRRGDS